MRHTRSLHFNSVFDGRGVLEMTQLQGQIYLSETVSVKGVSGQ